MRSIAPCTKLTNRSTVLVATGATRFVPLRVSFSSHNRISHESLCVPLNLILHSSTNSVIPSSASPFSNPPSLIFLITLSASLSPFSCVQGPRCLSSSGTLSISRLPRCPRPPRPRPRPRPRLPRSGGRNPGNGCRFQVRASSGPGSRVKP